jgi:hypothetical protein
MFSLSLALAHIDKLRRWLLSSFEVRYHQRWSVGPWFEMIITNRALAVNRPYACDQSKSGSWNPVC